MRARKSASRCSGATSRSNSSFGLMFATTRSAAMISPPSSSTALARPRSTSTRATGDEVRISTPREMQQHVRGSRRVGALEIADDRIEPERRLDRVGLEPAVQDFAGALGKQVEHVALAGLVERAKR